jgi:hypothetical protein
MTKKIFLSFVLALLSMAYSYGYDFEIDGIYYNYTSLVPYLLN